MTVEIEILTGAHSKRLMTGLHDQVWPEEKLRNSPWYGIQFAEPDLRVLLEEDGQLVCHTGIFWREAIWKGRKTRVGGIGDVMTHPDYRGRGLATLAIDAAIRTFKDERATDFALLFCDPELAEFYRSRNWKRFEGTLYAELNGTRELMPPSMVPHVFYIKRAPLEGELDLCGLPW